MDGKDEGVSEEFKREVEKLCKEIGPKEKENNALWKLVTEIWNQDEKDEE